MYFYVEPYIPEPPVEFELTEEEFNSWKTAHGFKGAVASKVCEKILKVMDYPEETFAQASARLGYGNTNNEETLKWYYDRGVLIYNIDEVVQTTNMQT